MNITLNLAFVALALSLLALTIAGHTAWTVFQEHRQHKARVITGVDLFRARPVGPDPIVITVGALVTVEDREYGFE